MKKIIFICPYFGKLPYEQTILWLKSCEINKNIDWIILTNDKTRYDLPKNVKIMYTTLEEISKDISKLFPFEINLNSAYKLCDFKPTYGYIFSELVNGYDYWGHCDLSDCIFGNFEKIIKKYVESEYDKIGFLGHMTLYRNTDEINKRFFKKSNSNTDLKNILGTPKSMAFDETFDYSINAIYIDNGYDIKRVDEIYSDISTLYFPFRTAVWSKDLKWDYISNEKFIFEWNNGSLYKIYLKNNKIEKEEIGYVHYQKRKFNYMLDCKKTNHFYLVPNKVIESKNEIDVNFVKKYTKGKLINTTLLKIKWNRLLKKIKEGRN